MNSAFVTGATGFVGSTLVDELLRRNFKVRCAVRKSSNLQWLEGKDVETVLVNLNDEKSIEEAMNGCHYIYHLAGTLFAGSERDFVQGNIQIAENIVSAALAQTQKIERFVYVSTIIAAGASQDGSPMKEEDECKPFSWYGISKYEAEKAILKHKEELPITVVRPGAVYGPRDYAMFASFKLSRTGVNIVLGERGKLGSVIHSEDLVRGIADASLSEKSRGEVYFLANEDFMRQEEFGETVIKAMGKRRFDIVIPYSVLTAASFLSEKFTAILGKKPILNHQKLKELKEPYIICSCEKAKRDFDFQPSITLYQGVESTLNWYRENKWL